MTQPTVQDMLAGLRAAYPSPPQLAEQLAEELDALDAVIRASAEHWHTTLPGRTWTPAQEAEHAVVVNEGTGKLVRLLLSDRPIRQGPEEQGVWQGGKRVAPASTQPSGDQTATQLLERSAASRPLLTVLAQPDPQRTFHHPFMGQLDALDWLRMAAYHTRHHRQAISRGLDALNKG